jgi:two-component system, OmpR family, alkaline phosphatase synthesis response regulator PhoP
MDKHKMDKILIVEDDGLMSRIYKRIFAAHGYSVDVAENGEEGLKKIKESKPDLVILDVMMPKMNGMELLKILKEDSKTSSINVILLTNLGVEEEVSKALTLGALDCIIKADHDPEEIVKKVEGIVQKRLLTNR